MTKSTANFRLSNPIHFLALGFGSGLAPIAPGTAGTLPGVLLAWGLSLLAWPWGGLLLIALTLLGVWLCEKTSADLGVHDHSGIVWDEIVGYAWMMLCLPWNVQTVLLAFVLFRFFDILKPWPISALDKHVHGGVGIMLDDCVAALFAWGMIKGAMLLLPGFF